jgi:hypothetical protein
MITIPSANLVELVVGWCEAEMLPMLEDDCTVNTLRAISYPGQEDSGRSRER